MDAYDISASAMTAQRLRMDVISSNLANVNTTRQEDGTLGAYRRRNVVFGTLMQQQVGSGGGMTSSMANGSARVVMENGEPVIQTGISNNVQENAAGVQVTNVSEDEKTPLRKVYDPSHPDADADGFVNYPNINPVTEMVDMLSASRAYEASVQAFQATKSMDKAAADI